MNALDAIARIRARSPRIAVAGDFLLDEWWSGRSERVAREAPAPVVELLEREHAPGGAANTAANLAALGARVSAIGLVGDDEAGRRVRARLAECGVDVTRLEPVPGARTTTKSRITVAGQLMLRLDDAPRPAWPEDRLEALGSELTAASAGADALVVCDYGVGALSDDVIARIAGLEGPARPRLLVVDAHDLRRWRRARADIVTPNAGEAALALGASIGDGPARAERLAARGSRELVAATGARAVVVTLDRDGTLLLEPDEPTHRTHAHPTPEHQASGAGDVFVAALAAARASELPLRTAVDVAQLAADVAVRKPGTCTCSLDELEAWLGRPEDAALDHETLAERIAEHRRAGERIVFTNGCFDVLHRGHTSYLRQAKRLGDVLVVAINGDDSVRRLKGPGRPINSANDRANLLAELECVDYVTIFDEDTPRALIRRLRPEIYAKGGDYSPEMLEETADVIAAGGQVAILDYVPSHSTTGIVERIRSTAP